MKTRRLFQVASGMLSLIFAVALLALSVLVALPFFNSDSLVEGTIFHDISVGVENVVAQLEFLNFDNYNGLIYIAAAFAAPGLLLLFGGMILFTKTGKVQFKFICADILIILGTVLFTALFEMNAKTIFGEDRGIAWMIGAGAGAFLLLLLVFVSLSKKKKKGEAAKKDKKSKNKKEQKEEASVWVTEETKTEEAPAEEVKAEAVEEAPKAEEAPVVLEEPKAEAVEMAVKMEEPAVAAQAQTEASEEPKPEVKEEPREKEPVTVGNMYVPGDNATVSDVVENTYGKKKVENLSASNMRKIQTLRFLLEANAISKDEYIALVDSYLKEDENK